MTRELRDLHARLAEAERAAKAALELRDVETAEAIMADVRNLRKQIADLEAEVAKEKQKPLTGYRIAGGADFGDGARVAVLAPQDKLTAWVRATGRTEIGASLDEQRHAFGQLVRAMAVGDWRTIPRDVRAALGTTPDSAGGFTVPDELAAFVLDLARANAVAIQAGVRTVPMESKTLTIPSLEADPTGGWKAENEAIGEDSTTAFGARVLTAKTWMVLVRMSLELLEDSTLAGQAVENAIAAAAGLALDKAILLGSGAGEEPLGVASTPGVLEVSLGANGGAITSYAPFSEAVQKIAENNGQAVAAILHPRDMGAIDRLTDTTGQPLTPPVSWQNLRKLTTSALPTNLTVGTATNASLALVGDFSNVFLGLRLPVTIQASYEAGDAWARGQVLIRARFRADVAVGRPTHIVKVTGIVPGV
ncbi:MAG TPA: phage major capsid protein [Firmicutes bacterium]|nr:phage major capsid protein [Bacillota bacterium]